jgi:hypothetical protein
MGEITVEVNGVEHTYTTNEKLACEHCDNRWLEYQDEEPEACPECGARGESTLIAEHITDYPKWLWNGAATIEEMVSRTEHKAEFLSTLREGGWILDDPPRDGHARLSRIVKKGSDKTEVTLSEQ